MIKYRCTNSQCQHKPILFEGDFVGTIKKKCPSCRQFIEFKEEKFTRLEKFCSNK